MAHYHRLGQIPRKRHTQFRQPDGTLYSEQLFGWGSKVTGLARCERIASRSCEAPSVPLAGPAR